MIVSQIVAVSENWIIGRNNDLPWNMPDDMAWFQRITMGHHVIMGRRNYEANGNMALSGRTNVVISRQEKLVLQDSIVVSSLENALDIARKEMQKEVFIIGGGEIYRLSMPITDRVYLTVIHTRLKGDTSYPELDMNKWEMMFEDKHSSDKNNQYDYTFKIFEKSKI